MKHIHQDLIDWLISQHFQVNIETKKPNSDFWASKYGETLLSYIDGVFSYSDYQPSIDAITDFQYDYNELDDYNIEEVHNVIKGAVSRFDEWLFFKTDLGRKVRKSLDEIKKDF